VGLGSLTITLSNLVVNLLLLIVMTLDSAGLKGLASMRRNVSLGDTVTAP
jgi:hypothetical protein